jgi:sarcosine oxidase subunit delta
MMLIPCPWCGPRSQVEFTYGGDATPRRPAPDASEAAWAEYVYLRDNPCGPHDELWYHGAGCRSWFRVRRDTRTHEILASAPVAEAADRRVDQPAGAPRDTGGSQRTR